MLNARTDVKIPSATRERVLSAAQRLGYHPSGPARQLAGGRTKILALVLRQTPEQVAGDAVLAETLRGFASAAKTDGFRVMVEVLSPDVPDAAYAALLREQHADGLVIAGRTIDEPSPAELVRDEFPVVLLGTVPDADVPSVDVDNSAGARQAVEHLLALGHRRIACITNAPLVHTAALARLDGYRAALAGAGVEPREERVAAADFDAPSGHAAMTRLLEQGDCTAVFAASDVVALGAMGALRAAGRRVPEDVSIVGFDDIPLAAYFDPPLTTVHLPAQELGHAVGTALTRLIAGRDVPNRTLLATTLTVRASTAPPSM